MLIPRAAPRAAVDGELGNAEGVVIPIAPCPGQLHRSVNRLFLPATWIPLFDDCLFNDGAKGSMQGSYQFSGKFARSPNAMIRGSNGGIQAHLRVEQAAWALLTRSKTKAGQFPQETASGKVPSCVMKRQLVKSRSSHDRFQD